MRILQIDLDNVKSYRHAKVIFAPGTNAICGQNGAGKSTLLEAIGFALFDFLAVKQDDFVRGGEKSATVTVHVADTDGRTYHVVRRCGGSSQYYVYDPELDQRLTDGKAETVAWLQEFLGVDTGTDLAVLFRDAVGVPQGLLTAAFLETASRRKDVFNPLLRVDEYERVWDALRTPRRRLEHQIAGVEKNITRLETESSALPGLRRQLAELTAQIAQSTQQQTAAQTALDDVVARKTALETHKAQLDALESAVTRVEATLQRLAAQHSDAQAALERAEAAQTVVEATADAHRAYLDAEERVTVLEDKRSARDQVLQEQQTCLHAHAMARQELARLEQTLATIAEAEAEMEALAPQVETQTRLELSLEDTRRMVERLENAQQTLARERSRLAEMETRLETLHTQLETRATLEVELQTTQDQLKTQAAQCESLAMQVSTQQAACQAIAEQIKAATRRLKDAQRALERAQQRHAELESKQRDIHNGLHTLADVQAQIETLQADIAALDEQDRAYTAQLAAGQAEQERLHTQSTVLTAAETANCPVCNAPLSPEHRATLLAQNQTRHAEIETVIAQTQALQKVNAKTRRAKEKALRTLEKQVQNLPRPAEADEVATQIAAQQRECHERQVELAAAQAEITTLEARQVALETALAKVHSQLTQATSMRDATQQAVNALMSRLNTLPRPGEAAELAKQLEAQHQVVAESEQVVSGLRGIPDEQARLEAELATLGDPRRAYQRAADVAAQRETATARHATLVTQLEALAAQRADLEVALAAYADLDDQLAAARADREKNTPDHQRYLQHEREAANVAERRAARDTLAKEMQTAHNHWETQCAARDAVKSQYDGEAYARLVDQHGMLRETLAGLVAGLKLQKTQQATIEQNIARLEEKQRELDAVRAERHNLIETQALLEYLRQVLRDAGPEVTRALVEMISLHADRLYTDIMQSSGGQNPPARLRWTEDYDIVLAGRDGTNRERSFQQLSGGEQMSAALAVRLALLREISTVDVAFFDEPTANLDHDRLTNLARQVLKIQDFEQLFVISHDDTFEQVTDFVIHIEKKNGESLVVI